MKQKSFNSDKNLILFFVLTLAWTWSCGLIPILLNITGTTLGNFIFYFGGGAPSVVGLFLVGLTFSKQQKRSYFKRCFNLKTMTVKWTLWTILFFTLISAVSVLISTKIFNYPMPEMMWLKTISVKPYMFPIFLLLSFVSGPLNEEFGWRGYSLDRLFIRFSYVKSNLILGVIWTVWHLFWYMQPEQAQYQWLQHSFLSAISYLPSVVLLTFIVSYVYVNTNRSICAGAFVHMMSNFITSQLLMKCPIEVKNIITIVQIVLCLIVIIISTYSKKFNLQFKHVVEEFKLESDSM